MAWRELQYPGTCRCGAAVAVGQRADWQRGVRLLQGCPACGGEGAGQAQGSAGQAPQASVYGAASVAQARQALAAHLARLDPDQAKVAALRPADGDAVILATAGSGKTTALVGALADAVTAGMDPGGIVACTFTRKGADELRERLARLLPPGVMARFRHVGTYDSLAVRTMGAKDPARWNMARNLDLPQKGRGDAETREALPSKGLIWDAILTGRKEGLPGTGGRGLDLKDPEVAAYTLALDVARSAPGTDAEINARVRAAEVHLGLERLSEAWDLYKQVKAALGAWDFLDARHAFYRALTAGEVAGARWVLVDEAQDNTALDLACAVGLAQRGGGSLVLIGDVRQSIFEWRGGAPEILAERSRTARTLTMARNYRSGARIVRAGNLIAAGQPWSVGPDAVAARDTTGEVALSRHGDALLAAEAAADSILADGGDLSQVAVLCRTNAAAGLYEAALLQQGVPCVVVGGSAFFARREVQDALAYLTLSERDDAAALARAVRAPRTYLGAVYLAAVAQAPGATLPARLLNAAHAARGNGVAAARGFSAFLAGLRTPDLTLAERAERIATRLATGAKDVGGDAEQRGHLALALAQIARRFTSLADLLAFAERCVNATVTVGEDAAAPAGRVTISTIHKAKGREWARVFLDVTQGAFPHSRSAMEPRRMAEERRLFYVAVTRAKDRLDLTYCEEGLYPHTGGQSPFLGLVMPEVTPPEGGAPQGGGEPQGGAWAEVDVTPEGNGGENPDPSAEAERAILALIGPGREPSYADLARAVDRYGVEVAEAAAGLPSMADLAAVGIIARVDAMDASVDAAPAQTPILTDGEDRPSAGGAGWSPETWAAAVAVAEAGTAAEPAARPGAGGRYVEITTGDFAALLEPLGFTAREEAGQVVFAAGGERTHGQPAIKVYTSIPAAGEAAREVGEDSIKVAGLWHQNGDPKAFPLHKRLPYATRTRGWREAVLARVAEVSHLFAAEPCRRCGAPTVERSRRDGSGTFRGCVRFSLCKPHAA